MPHRPNPAHLIPGCLLALLLPLVLAALGYALDRSGGGWVGAGAGLALGLLAMLLLSQASRKMRHD